MWSMALELLWKSWSLCNRPRCELGIKGTMGVGKLSRFPLESPNMLTAFL